jgi:5-methyltetrahydrofolate--homocysteine methyltransferase
LSACKRLTGTVKAISCTAWRCRWQKAAADYLHDHIRRELGLDPTQGKRYSWGYPAIPDLEDHLKVFDLLPAEQELGISLTTAYQLVPEQSTAAVIVHHPKARYFNVGESRIDQLVKAG